MILTKQIPDTTRLVKNLDYNAKVSEIESKIPSITGFATSAALTSVENKIPDINQLIKKKKKIMLQKLVNLKRKLLIIIMVNILLLQNLII